MREKMDQLLRLAMQLHATDIHFTVKNEAIAVHMRGVNGLEAVYCPAIDMALFNYLKYISNLDLGNTSIPQSGNFQYQYAGDSLFFRFSLLRTLQLQTAVLRILNNHETIALEDLSDDAKQLTSFLRWTKGRSGLIIFSGPTGSGKSTTLHALLHKIAKDQRLQVTSLEDPIEIVDASYLQLQINEKSNFTYEEGIRQLMRHDPDVIMIGEIRDPGSAKMLLRSALSGHLIFTTIHAKCSSEAIKRLQEFGLQKEDLKHTLTAVVSQRLFTLKEKEERQCIYEIMEGEALSYCLQYGEEPKDYENIYWKIKRAVACGKISKQEAEADIILS